MGFDLQSGAGLGAGADALQAQLRTLFDQATKKQALAQEQQRIQLEAQRNQQAQELQRAQLASIDEARKSEAQARQESAGLRFAGTLPQGANLSQSGLSQLSAAGMNGPEFVQHRDATLPSTNMSGAVRLTGAAPALGTLKLAQNPGQAARDTFMGTSSQQAADQARQDRQTQIEQARVDRYDAARQATQDKQDTMRIAAGMRPPPQDHFQLVPGTGADGKPAMFRVNTKTGEAAAIDAGGGSLGKPAALDSTTANRLQSAKAVTQTGDDIVSMLRDPKVMAKLGPAMSRYNSVADFVGAPPPEFSKLAGMIESYSLANMGVHGMRSNNGAEAIKGTLGLTRHTPESMIATIQGLNGFANHLLENNGRGASGPAATVKDPLGIR